MIFFISQRQAAKKFTCDRSFVVKKLKKKKKKKDSRMCDQDFIINLKILNELLMINLILISGKARLMETIISIPEILL